ncbi:F-box protein CPR1-like [Apium graveolens]|uniref:F-box protein CPR1-like n=1 Tax=Apium graveolens TaxID=4045 RepID=UPI003D78EDFE
MSLPNELIFDQVLSRVPVKYLLRCGCVSKEWCSVIDSVAFIKKHLKNAVECKTNGVIFVADNDKFYLTDNESVCDDNVGVIETNDPVRSVLSGADFLGAANGLMCFCKNKKSEFILFNPSTRKFRKVSSIPREFAGIDGLVEVALCGFGYDRVNDDYKVVRIGQFAGGNQFYLVVVVYSMRSDSWTRIQDVPGNICITPERGRFAGGVLYWLAMKYQVDFRGSIVGFDLGLGRFTEVPCPAVRGKVFMLVSAGESLCVLDNYNGSSMDVWLMNSAGMENSWSGMENSWYRAFSVEKPGALGNFKFVKPVAFSESGKCVLLEVDRAKLIWYDLVKKAAKNIRIRGIPSKFDSYAYTESLLQLTEGKQLDKSSHGTKEKKQQKKREDFLSKGFRLKL